MARPDPALPRRRERKRRGPAAGSSLPIGGWWAALEALALQLDLPALLGSRAADLEEVAYSLGTQRQATALFLAACEGLDLVERHGEVYRLGGRGRSRLVGPSQADDPGAGAPADARVVDALGAALWGSPALAPHPLSGTAAPSAAGPRAAAPILPFHRAPAAPSAARRAYLALQEAHAEAAAGLGAVLALPVAGMVVEIGGQAIYARALLARAPHLRAAVAETAPWVHAAAIALGDAADDLRLRAIANLDALGQRAVLALVARTLHSEAPGALRGLLVALRPHLAPGAAVVALGVFQLHPPRPFDALWSLIELADGLPGWYPTIEAVARAMSEAGYSVTQTLTLAAPHASVVGRLETAGGGPAC
jgi:hypothetical protein